MANGSGKTEYVYKGHNVRIQAAQIPAPVTIIRVDLWIDENRIEPMEPSDFEPRSFSKIEDAITHASQAAERITDNGQ